MVTIYDVAEKCNKSVATVSYVLNGKAAAHKISEKTSQLILSTASQMGYVSKTVSPSGGKRVGLYWVQENPEITFTSVVEGLNAAISSVNYPVSPIIRPYSLGHLKDDRELFSSVAYDSAVVFGANDEDLLYLSRHKPRIPVVLVNREISGYTSVSINDREAAEIAARHALSKTKDDIWLVVSPVVFYGMDNRGKNFISVCEAGGASMDGHVLYSETTIEAGYKLGLEILKKGPRAGVIVCICDAVAYGILSAINEFGSFDNDLQIMALSAGPKPLFAHCVPSLTVVDLKMNELAERSFMIACDLAHYQDMDPQQIILHPTLICRQSCPVSI